jgi:hypothetical protein
VGNSAVMDDFGFRIRAAYAAFDQSPDHNRQKDSHQFTDSDWPSHLFLSERIEDLKLDGLRGTDTEKRG